MPPARPAAARRRPAARRPAPARACPASAPSGPTARSRSGPTRTRRAPPACCRSWTSTGSADPTAVPRCRAGELRADVRRHVAHPPARRAPDAAAAPGAHRLLHRGQRAGGGDHRRRAGASAPEDWFVPGAARDRRGAVPRAAAAHAHGADVRQRQRHRPGPADALSTRARAPATTSSMSSCVATQLPHATGIAMAARIKGEDGGAGLLRRRRHQRGGLPRRRSTSPRSSRRRWCSSARTTSGRSRPRCELQTRLGRPSRIKGAGLRHAVACASTATTSSPCTPPSSRRWTARARAAAPRFIEAVTYRMGAHSSSDDPTRYRDEAEPDRLEGARIRCVRFRTWLLAQGVIIGESESRSGRRAGARDPRGHRRWKKRSARRRCDS